MPADHAAMSRWRLARTADPQALFTAVFPSSDLHDLDCLPTGRS